MMVGQTLNRKEIAMKVEKIGRRYYITGQTYAAKDAIKAAGCKWDPNRRAWWTGKKEVAERFDHQAPAELLAIPHDLIQAAPTDTASRACVLNCLLVDLLHLVDSTVDGNGPDERKLLAAVYEVRRIMGEIYPEE
jgi:hypothetical protein